MRLTKREILIMQILFQGQTSLDEMCKRLKISEKTLRNEIKKINSSVSSYETMISIRQGIAKFESVYSIVHWRNILKLNLAISDEDYVFLKLAFKNEWISMADFASEIYISKAKLEKLIYYSPLLKNSVKGIRNLGIRLKLEHFEKINSIINVLLPYIDDLNYLVTSRVLINQVIDNTITIERYKQLIVKFNQFIDSAGLISDVECKVVFLLILLKEAGLAVDAKDYLKLSFIPIPNEDEMFKEKVKLVLAHNNLYAYDDLLIDELQKYIYETQSHQYFPQLPKVVGEQIVTDYKLGYKLAEDILNLIDDSHVVVRGEQTKYYITLYIQTIINQCRARQEITILVISSYGEPFFNYIEVWLMTEINPNIKTEKCSILQFWQQEVEYQCKLSDYDLVITTVSNLEIDKTKLHKLSRLPSLKDKIQISQKLKEKKNKSKAKRPEESK